jgi:hypothetical protein
MADFRFRPEVFRKDPDAEVRRDVPPRLPHLVEKVSRRASFQSGFSKLLSSRHEPLVGGRLKLFDHGCGFAVARANRQHPR